MISLPDFKEKQLLFVKAEWGTPSHLRFHNDNIVFDKKGEDGVWKVANRVSVHKAFAVFISGDLSFTTKFLKEAKEHGVSIFFLKNNLEMYTGMMTTAEGHYLLRGKQYLLSPAAELVMAKEIVENKVRNQVALLKEKATTEEKEKAKQNEVERENQTRRKEKKEWILIICAILAGISLFLACGLGSFFMVALSKQ